MAEDERVLEITLHGAGGRMGREVADLIRQNPETTLTSCWESAESPLLGQDLFAAETPVTAPFESSCGEVVIDFTVPPGVKHLVTNWPDDRGALVSGTTGLDAATMALLHRLAERIPVFYATNMSLGIYLLHRLARQAVTLVGKSWDVELVEMHHNRKADAPSGTALSLVETIRAHCPRPLSPVFGREGQTGARSFDELGVMALRGGGVVGEHEVILAGSAETVRIEHQAYSRKIFAEGALRAARWIVSQPPGFYGMDDLFKHGLE